MAAPAALSGGDSVAVKIESMQRIRRDEYRLVMVAPFASETPERATLYLTYRPRALGWRRPQMIRLPAYRECVRILAMHFEKGETFRFGRMGTGLVPVAGEPGAYRSHALAALDEPGRGRVCYSFGEPI